ncbi:hypothetical protein [Sporanaerobacter sp. PP17-6a]|jgi:hypothetical protein|uniref:hypothetical protein n=1 Tax=Sporanaerobacter sp. PP17-6a TaxID=1891289 RepID=UPI00089FC78B|nr:hypothetical protein [Sporanaerobacter sp. PP17-6a]SCL89182.1 hypothetical protein PP176A_1706 [Sporanaerobacter sp. PP17-6a]
MKDHKRSFIKLLVLFMILTSIWIMSPLTVGPDPIRAEGIFSTVGPDPIRAEGIFSTVGPDPIRAEGIMSNYTINI